METPFSEDIVQIADSMGISLYQRFSEQEASLFLRCPRDTLQKLRKQGGISYIQLAGHQAEYFGHQLIEHLLKHLIVSASTTQTTSSAPDRIVRAPELQELTGLSRTTLWRLERKGEFPNRVPLGVGSVGWKLSEVENWIANKTRTV